jgi:hypothetical protein
MNAANRDTRVDTEIVAPLRGAGSGLDDLHRARLASAIEAALDRHVPAEQAMKRAAWVGGARRRVWLGRAGIAASAALAAAIAVRATRAPHPIGGRVVSNPAVATAPAQSVPALLVPYQPAREATASLTPSTSLLALAGEKVRATIGTRIRLTLVGAGRVSVLPIARAGEVELALEDGRLLVDFDGRGEGSLRVHAAGTVTTVVGTLFAVEAKGPSSRVAVARGHVRTQDADGHLWQIDNGRSWSSTDGRVVPIAGDLAAALTEHDAGWAVETTTSANARGAGTRPQAARSRHSALHAPAVDLESLYLRAEGAMRDHALTEARAALETIATSDPGGRLGEAALLDLARLALAEGDREAARRALARLPSPLHDAALVETAEHLRCRAASTHPAADRDGDDPCPIRTPGRAR